MHLGESEIKEGSQGLDVKRLQEILNGGGYNAGPIDGIFGSQTKAAVKAYQTAKGLIADGIVGAQTWAALMVAVTPTIPPPAPIPTAGRPGGGGAFSFLDTLSMPMLVAVGVGAMLLFSGGKKR